MQTVSACRRCGLKPVLSLASFVETDLNDLRSNLLLDYIMGAEVNIVSQNGDSIEELKERFKIEGQEYIRSLENQGYKCYNIPPGGNNEIGSLGFISGFVEIYEQMEGLNQKLEYIVHSTGTGGTLAGLASGRKLMGADDTKIISICVSEKGNEYEIQITDMANLILKNIGADVKVDAEELNIDRNYFAPGYEMPSEAGNEAIRRLARTEGILTDPVYSGKGFAGLLDYIQSGRIPQGSNVVFLHTGGATALFSEQEIVGDIATVK